MTDEATRSEPPAAIEQFHDQDWLIILEALVCGAAIRPQLFKLLPFSFLSLNDLYEYLTYLALFIIAGGALTAIVVWGPPALAEMIREVGP